MLNKIDKEATNADKDRQSKSMMPNQHLKTNASHKTFLLLEKSLEDAKSNIVAKTAELEKLKTQDAAAQAELETAEKKISSSKKQHMLYLWQNMNKIVNFDQLSFLKNMQNMTLPITNGSWITPKDSWLLQPKDVTYWSEAIGKNAEKS